MPNSNSHQQLVPEFRVFVNGNQLSPEAAATLLSVKVQEDVTAPSMFALELVNWDLVQLQVTWTDDDLFAPGNEVEIQMGYVDAQETLIIGEIVGLEPEFCASRTPTLTVRGYDRRHRLLRGQQTHTFIQMKDSDIASQIASDFGLQAEVEDTGVTLDYVLQHNQTPLAFLQERAQRIGYEVVVEDKTLYFRPYRHQETEILTLNRDSDLIEFYPRLSTLSQVGEVKVRGWNLTDKEAIVGQAGAGDEGGKMGGTTSGPAAADEAFGQATATSINQPIFSQAEADRLAQGRFKTIALSYITGEGTCVGKTDLRAGTVIEIAGIGERFSGLYYILSTTHIYAPNRGYRTHFTFRRNAT